MRILPALAFALPMYAQAQGAVVKIDFAGLAIDSLCSQKPYLHCTKVTKRQCQLELIRFKDPCSSVRLIQTPDSRPRTADTALDNPLSRFIVDCLVDAHAEVLGFDRSEIDACYESISTE